MTFLSVVPIFLSVIPTGVEGSRAVPARINRALASQRALMLQLAPISDP